MKRWLIAMLIAALLAGMACVGSVAEEDGAAENAAPAEAQPAPEPEPELAPAPVQEAPAAEAPKAEPVQEAPKAEVKEEPKAEVKEESKAEIKQETKAETREETKAETREETKAEARPEAETQAGPEGNAETAAEPTSKAATGGEDSTGRTSDDDGGSEGSGDADDTDGSGDAPSHDADPKDTESPAPTDPESPAPDPDDTPDRGDGETDAPDPGTTPDPISDTEESSAGTRQIQSWLAALGYLSEAQITGVYDEATRSAVERFQADNGLTVTGECDGTTRSMLRQKAEGGGATEPVEPSEAPEAASGSEANPEPGANPGPDASPESGANPAGGMMPGRGGRRGGFGGAAGNAAKGGAEEEQQDDALNGVTPGEALTSTHASGDKDATPYGALDVEADIFALGIECEGTLDYAYAVDGGALTLSGDDRWTFGGAALRTLSKSGVSRLVLSGSRTAVLDTAPHFTGLAYAALRSGGYTENTFEYSVDMTGGSVQITVNAGGESYLLGADGVLVRDESDGGQ